MNDRNVYVIWLAFFVGDADGAIIAGLHHDTLSGLVVGGIAGAIIGLLCLFRKVQP